jgi:hypothetical protein
MIQSFFELIFRNMQRTSMLKTYKKAGCWIMHIYGPWINLNEAFQLCLAEDGFFEIEVEDECDE